MFRAETKSFSISNKISRLILKHDLLKTYQHKKFFYKWLLHLEKNKLDRASGPSRARCSLINKHEETEVEVNRNVQIKVIIRDVNVRFLNAFQNNDYFQIIYCMKYINEMQYTL